MNQFQNNERRLLVEGIVQSFLKLLPLTDAVKYAKNINTNEEFIRITNVLGSKYFIDITDKDNADVAVEVSHLVLLGAGLTKKPPKGYIRDIEKKKEIAPLFKSREGASYE